MTWLPRGGGLRDVVAFDVGPCNLLLDGLMTQATYGQQSIDRNGALASRGRVRDALVKALLRHPFFARRPPKSTGREEFGEGYLQHVRRVAARHRLSLEDTLASSCTAIARTIRRAGAWAIDEVIAGGGGVRNRELLAALKREFEPGHVTSMERSGVKSQALEAMAFAVLAYETIRGVPANLPWVTGAKSAVVLGTVTPGRDPFAVKT